MLADIVRLWATAQGRTAAAAAVPEGAATSTASAADKVRDVMFLFHAPLRLLKTDNQHTICPSFFTQHSGRCTPAHGRRMRPVSACAWRRACLQEGLSCVFPRNAHCTLPPPPPLSQKQVNAPTMRLLCMGWEPQVCGWLGRRGQAHVLRCALGARRPARW